jgi:molybdenum cofactor cytidylyltransferase
MTVGVVLGAGAGRRFGAVKQLAPWRGRPLLQHAIDAATAAPELDRVVVVLGAHAAEVGPRLTPGRADVVVCDGWAEGLAASLRRGVEAAGGADWVVVTLGDEPLVTPAEIAAVVRATGPAVDAVRATRGGTPAHPVALGRAIADRVATLRGDAGARGLLAGARIAEVELGPRAHAGDVDTPEDLAALPGG